MRDSPERIDVHCHRNPGGNNWLTKLLVKKGKGKARLVTVAMANKMARIAWAVLSTGGTYQAPEATVA